MTRDPAGRQPRPVGTVTRGTTAPRRLRRVDAWIAANLGDRLRVAADPLVVDLGFGAAPVTTTELLAGLSSTVGQRLRVIGLDIDPARVALATEVAADPPRLDFGTGGFELAGVRPVVVRAMNVLRQYDEAAVGPAWATMTAALAPGGVLVEGTCDETGRLATWVAVDARGPRSLTLSAALPALGSPATLAQRLPKALIHRNVPGERVHDLIEALDRGWRGAAPYAALGPRQRWWHTIAALRDAAWPVVGGPGRWHRGEVTLRWSAVAPGP
ncbi:MAG: class I SAM-dependent methyltransferase [Dactylosporangium sp.]|nr:class I SAM-dependent methyltransferase [Dactylosporangium sp.]NNJ61730.1 class I SAM-dependent methyltransferase [Dactylosporangium sp.]